MGQWNVAPFVLVAGLVVFRPPLFASLVLIVLCALYGFLSMRRSQSFKRSNDSQQHRVSTARAKKWLVVLGSGGHTTEMMLMLKGREEAQTRRNTYHFIYTSEHCRNACKKAMAGRDSRYWWISRSRSVRKTKLHLSYLSHSTSMPTTRKMQCTLVLSSITSHCTFEL